MAAVTFSWRVTLAVRKEGVAVAVGTEVAEVTGDKKGKKGKRGKGGGMLKASCHTGGNTNKKKD